METAQPILCKFNAFLKKQQTHIHLTLKPYEKCFCNRGLPRRNDGVQQA